MTQKSLPLRGEVPLEETWNLESIFASAEEWEAAYQYVENRIPKMEKFRGTLAQGPERLVECLKALEDLLVPAAKILVYSGLDQSVDMGDQDASARMGQARGLLSKARAAVAFIEPELMSIGFDMLEEWTAADPQLAVYQHYFDQLERRKAHVRPAEVEQVLAMASEPLNPQMMLPAYAFLTSADLHFEAAVGSDGEEMEVGQSSIGSLITHPDREIRRTAWENYADAYLAYKNTLAGLQTMAIQRDVFFMRARNYASSLEASLKPNNIPVEVFHNLIEVFKRNLPIWHRYWRARRKALGYDKLHVYDIKAPIGDSKPEIPYDLAVEWITDGMAPMGEEYVEVLRAGCMKNRWVDRARNKGKQQGAFSWGTYGTQPFILMSYADDVFSLSTLAHELGHSMHSYFSNKTQPFIYSQYTLFAAEVASNFNQAMVRDYLLRSQSDTKLQLALLEETMSNYHRYFFIMPTLARFELEMHKRVENGAPISAQQMIDYTAELFKEGYASEVEFDHERIGITWAQFGHMHRNFYVYQYATGISAAHALVDRVLDGKNGAAEKYIDFLKAGNSIYPLDALKMAGIDMTEPEPVEKAFKALEGYVDQFEKLVN